MPPLSMFGRHWRISSDDFVCPAIAEFVVRLSWIFILVFVFIFHIQVMKYHLHSFIIWLWLAGSRKFRMYERRNGLPANFILPVYFHGNVSIHVSSQPDTGVAQFTWQDCRARVWWWRPSSTCLCASSVVPQHCFHNYRVYLDWVWSLFYYQGFHPLLWSRTREKSYCWWVVHRHLM